jgi:hypothetical protein
MEYKPIINRYREKLKDKEEIKFIDFLETVFEWLDLLVERKRLSRDDLKTLESFLPQKTIKKLDIICVKGSNTENLYQLKVLLLSETQKLIDNVINTGRLLMTDFDLLQFNLYQIFGKESLASMIEWARVSLSAKIKERKRSDEKKVQDEILKEKKRIDSFKKLSLKEQRQLVIKQMFDFTPSARTDSERSIMLSRNRERIVEQRKKFHNFASRLVDAMEEAKKTSQQMIYREMVNVQTDVKSVGKAFQKKAIEIASPEGPIRKVGKAHENILQKSEILQSQLEGVGEKWKEAFRKDVTGARKRITSRQTSLHEDEARLEKQIVSHAEDELSTAVSNLSYHRDEFIQDIDKVKIIFSKRGEEITLHGSTEINTAINYVMAGKQDFIEDVSLAQSKFKGKDKSMIKARDNFTSLRDDAQTEFTNRANEIEGEMYGTIYNKRRNFINKRNLARDRINARSVVLQTDAGTNVLSKRQAFYDNVEVAKGKFSKSTISQSTFKNIKSAAAPLSKVGIKIMSEGRKRNQIMQKKMQKSRELFAYDVRFAKYEIQQNAQVFMDKILDKQEEFLDRGAQVVARHKAHQKSQLIQNLLRTIRTMK